MNFEDALKTLKGAESVGGDLIVHRDGRNILVGRNVQGVLIVVDTEEARLIAAEIGVKVLTIDDEVSVADTPAPVEEAAPVEEPAPKSTKK